MGIVSKLLKHPEVETMVQQHLGSNMSNFLPTSASSNTPPTRWEKAVIALNSIVHQVAKIDPDGVDIVCFGGSSSSSCDIVRNVKDTDGLADLVNAQDPSGPCHMGAALQTVLDDALRKSAQSSPPRPCSILVVTAGCPDDSTALTAAIHAAAERVATMELTKQKLPWLTITFVQVGDDPQAEAYLRYVDDHLIVKSKKNGKKIDIVDTIKDEEIKKAMKELKYGKGGKAAVAGGAIVGAFAGAAMGVGGLYLYNKINAQKRKKKTGWSGKWKLMFDGDEVSVLTVEDDMRGNLFISGFPADDDEANPVTTSKGNYYSGDSGLAISYTEICTGDRLEGTVEDAHTLVWTDGTRWEEVPPTSAGWTAYAGAAAAGAVAGGAIGGLLSKKFFRRASRKIESDYVIVLDRSAKMAVPDTGK